MRLRRSIELEHGLKQIDIAPLIDVVFQLLIFFMLTSSFVIQPGIRVNLPKAVTSEIIKPENIEMVISAENVLYIKGKVVTLGELKKMLKTGARQKQSVLIKADRRASLGRVVEVWDICRDTGIVQINIATDQQ